MIETYKQLGVEIIVDKPPIWDSIVQAFGIIPQTAVFTYGNKIYNPSGQQLADHIIEHEKVHMQQQNYSEDGAILWWGKFLRDPEFRIDQEAQAYGKQYAFICLRSKQFRGVDAQFKLRMDLGRLLSGPLYNHAVGCNEAMGLIKKYSGMT